jgi:hypothetical protein
MAPKRPQTEPTRTRRLAAAKSPKPADPACENCGGVKCGTARIPVCCGNCTH